MDVSKRLSVDEIAQRLHEDVCQSLSAAALQAALLERRLEERRAEESVSATELRTMLRETSAQLRALLDEIRPSADQG